MKNIILITVDCLRNDFLELDKEIEFDALRRLFDEGMVYSNTITAGANTLFAFPSIFSSTYSSMYGTCNLLSKKRTTLAEAMRRNGYETAGFHSNPHLIDRYGYARGFQHYYDYTSSKKNKFSKFVWGFRRRYKEKFKNSTTIKNIVDFLSDSFISSLVQKYISNKRPYDDAKTINNKVINWLNKRNKNRNFFSWIHYMEPHAPFEIYPSMTDFYRKHHIDSKKAKKLYVKSKDRPGEITAEEKSTLKYLYLSQIKYLNYRLKELLTFLSKSSILKKSIIILTADHGGELLEHGLFGHARGPYQKKRDVYLYNSVLKIPFVICGKDINSKHQSKLISSLDIAPTICGLAGIKKPKEWLGNDIFSRDFKRNIAISEQLYFDNNKLEGAFSFQNKKEKFIYNTYDNSYKYFRLDEDPDELNDLIDDYPDKEDKIKKLYDEHIKLIDTTKEKLPEKEIDIETKRRLKELGYM